MGGFLLKGGPAFALFAAFAVLTIGCGQPAGPASGSGAAAAPATKDRAVASNDDHSDWWYPEHGLPEEVCDLCSKKYRQAEKAKGNWCEHNRVKTSCFKCNPGLKAKYAAEYMAKFGKNPPATEEDEAKEKE